MKFLCIKCDEAMAIEGVPKKDHDGALSVQFNCSSCDSGIILLTNTHETQLVTSLGVKIGKSQESERSDTKTGGCPFAGMLSDGDKINIDLSWTDDAAERLNNIPEFVRPMARKGIETFAKTEGISIIDVDVLEKARTSIGM